MQWGEKLKVRVQYKHGELTVETKKLRLFFADGRLKVVDTDTHLFEDVTMLELTT